MSNCTSDITLIGWVVRDPEVRTSAGGKTYGTATIAINKSYPKEVSNFYTCLFNQTLTERMQKANVKKGSLIKVTGELTHLVYEKTDPQTKQPTGDHGFELRVNGNSWDFIPSATKKNETAPATAGSTTPAPAATTGTAPADGFDALPTDVLGDDDLPF